MQIKDNEKTEYKKDYHLPTGYRFVPYSDGDRDTSGAGWLHWVAVKREYQGKGLSKPLITYVLKVMKKFGYTHAN